MQNIRIEYNEEWFIFYYQNTTKKIGSISYDVHSNICTLLYLDVEENFKKQGFSYILLFEFCKYLKSIGVNTIELDDASDLSSQFKPTSIDEKGISIYTKLGCKAVEDDWESPERICNVDFMLQRLNKFMPPYNRISFTKK